MKVSENLISNILNESSLRTKLIFGINCYNYAVVNKNSTEPMSGTICQKMDLSRNWIFTLLCFQDEKVPRC